jgi:hypothetical protein
MNAPHPLGAEPDQPSGIAGSRQPVLPDLLVEARELLERDNRH